jgi:hypothetical protein
MRLFGQASTSLAKTVAMSHVPGQVASGDDDLPFVTIGMVLPLFWSGRATRCGALPRPSRDTAKR